MGELLNAWFPFYVLLGIIFYASRNDSSLTTITRQQQMWNKVGLLPHPQLLCVSQSVTGAVSRTACSHCWWGSLCRTLLCTSALPEKPAWIKQLDTDVFSPSPFWQNLNPAGAHLGHFWTDFVQNHLQTLGCVTFLINCGARQEVILLRRFGQR